MILTVNIDTNLVRGEKQLAVLPSVLLCVLKIDGSKALAHGASGFISCQDALARHHDGISNPAKLLLHGFAGVAEVGGHLASSDGGSVQVNLEYIFNAVVLYPNY